MKREQIKYGDFTNDQWHTINGLESVSHVVTRLKEEIDWTGFQLWVHGSILCNVDTHDIDLTILGPMIPQRINEILEQVVEIGFEEQTYCDVKYSISNRLWDPKADGKTTIRYACYRGQIQFGEDVYTYAEKISDLYLKEFTFPMIKTLRTGYDYQTPQRIV